MEQIIYVKRFIKTEDDLPKKHGRYDTDEGSVEFDPNNKQHIDYWLPGMFWYLQLTTLAELINDNYVPKDFLMWMFFGSHPFVQGYDVANECYFTDEVNRKKWTIDELLQYWKEQIRDK